MAKNAFWNEASRCGAIVGLVNVAFELGKMSVPSIAFVLGLANFVVTIYLLWRFASGALGYGFYGLFISIGAKREPDMFDSSDEE